MNNNPNISEEELLREKEWMTSRGKHSYDHRMIKRKMIWRKIVFIALIVFIVISIFALLFVLIYRRINKDETLVRVGDYEILIDNNDKDVKLTFDPDRGTYDILLGSGVTRSYTSQSLDETTLLGSSGTDINNTGNVIGSFIELAKDPALRYTDAPETGVGKEFGVMYFDDDDKAYLATFDSFYANRFYVVNNEEDDLNYNFTVKFVPGSNDCYKAARLIVAVAQGSDLTLYAFGVKDDNDRNVVCQSNFIENKNGRGVNFLLDPNYKDEEVDYTKGVVKFVREPGKSSPYDITVPEHTWLFSAMEYDGENYSISLPAGVISAKSNLRMTFLLYFEASDPDHNVDINNGTMGFYFSIDIK